MRNLLALVTCLYVLTGCKNPTKDFQKLADDACACNDADAACGQKVMADIVTFAEHNRMSDGEQTKMVEAGKRINDCLLSTGVGPKAVTAALEKMDR